MKVGFWNVNNNQKIKNLICKFVETNQIDFLILFECVIDPVDLLLELNAQKSDFHYYQSNVSDFIQIFIRFSTDLLKDLKDEYRVSAKEYRSPLGPKINFVLLHLPSKLFYEEGDQDALSSEIKMFIDELENDTNNTKTIVLGDFNMNPFQRGMIQSTGLHSTFDRRTALKNFRSIKQKEYKFFYNPMWSFYGESGKGNVHGSYFYSSAKPACYFWNIFDQVLMRPSLVKTVFDEGSLNIVSNIGSVSLINNNGYIDKKISDHLPIEFELNNI